VTNQRLEQIFVLLEEEKYGVLATMSHQYPGFPFGSLCPFAAEPDGNLLILVSSLAEHAKNLRSDPKASLYIPQTKSVDDPQNVGRVCILASASIVERDQWESAAKTYLARFPTATTQLSLGDFYFLRLVPEHLRRINGFGSMFWMHQSEYQAVRVDDEQGAG